MVVEEVHCVLLSLITRLFLLLLQARIVDELGDCVPGLIPAKHLQET